MKKQILKTIIITAFLISMPLSANSETNNNSQLSVIEKTIFNTSYPNETDEKRLERLELEVFGIKNPQNSLDDRIEKLTETLGIENQEEINSTANELYADQKAGEGVEYPQIDELESILLGSVYKTDDIYSRLERLEQKAFGIKQKGELSQRVETLKNHASSKISAFKNTQKDTYLTELKTPNYTYEGASDIKLQLSALENFLLGTDYSTEDISPRLTRLENKIFQRNFNEDDVNTRIMRIQATTQAERNNRYYDNNKVQKYASTGLQAASILLMILAFIL